METRRSARLPKYDYGKQGVYFVTLCTYQRQCTLSTVGRDKVNCPKGKRGSPGGHHVAQLVCWVVTDGTYELHLLLNAIPQGAAR